MLTPAYSFVFILLDFHHSDLCYFIVCIMAIINQSGNQTYRCFNGLLL